MKDKIYDFILDYEDLIKLLLLIIFILFISCSIVDYFDKKLTREKNIIENTKEYVIFSNCHSFDNKFYCWEEKNDKK